MPRTLTERLDKWTIAVPESGCLIWLGCLSHDGYSKIRSMDGETLGHRQIYKELVGSIPDDLEIDHICNVRACLNHHHLRVITHAANIGRADYTKNHRNGRKTHCPKGHEYVGSNLIQERQSDWRLWRKCRTCDNANQRRRHKSKINRTNPNEKCPRENASHNP